MKVESMLMGLVVNKRIIAMKGNKSEDKLSVLVAFSSVEERNVFSEYLDSSMMRRAMLMRSQHQAWISIPLGSDIHKKFLEARALQPMLMD